MAGLTCSECRRAKTVRQCADKQQMSPFLDPSQVLATGVKRDPVTCTQFMRALRSRLHIPRPNRYPHGHPATAASIVFITARAPFIMPYSTGTDPTGAHASNTQAPNGAILQHSSCARCATSFVAAQYTEPRLTPEAMSRPSSQRDQGFHKLHRPLTQRRSSALATQARKANGRSPTTMFLNSTLMQE